MNIDKEKFLFLYQSEFGSLSEPQKQGLNTLLDSIMNDTEITDIRHACYMLATVKHECAGTWRPIEEYGKGVGRPYGKTDPVTGKVYYGRGYVQLTWGDNYKAMSQALGADLYNNPDLALLPVVAYRIMSWGMRKGSFTGVKLLTYINDKGCDYVHARKIINGMDCADKIAEYASKIEGMLKYCLQESTNG